MKRSLPYLLFGALTLACFWRFLLFGETLYDVPTLEAHLGAPRPASQGWFESNRPSVDRGDTILSLPMLNQVYNEGLHHGELRLWNPYLFCGYPLYNNLLVHPFYPPNMILHAVLPPRITYDANLLLHFFFTGAAMFWLLRGMGRSDAAATGGALIWMLYGYGTFWFSTGTVMGASVFAPLALLGIQTGLFRRDQKPFALGGMAMGFVILGSHGQHALHLLIFFAFWFLVLLIRDRETRPFILKAGGLFLAATVGAGTAAILTQLDSIHNGLRIPGQDFPLHYAAPWQVLTWIAGVSLGKVCYAPDGLLRSEFTIYAGMIGTLLAVAGAVRNFRDPWIRFVSIFAVVALLIAFVKPLAQLALYIPFLNLSMPARWVYVFGFCLSILAAAGVDSLIKEPARTARIALIPGAASLLLLMFYLNVGALAETLVGAGLAIAGLLSASRSVRLGLGLCLAALLVDLLPNFILFNHHSDPRPLDQTLEAVKVASSREKEPWRAVGSLRLPDATPANANGWTLSIGNNFLALQGVEAVMGYESIAPMSTVRYCIETSGPRSVMGSGRVLAVYTVNSKLLDLANMKYVFMPFEHDPKPNLRTIGTWGPLVLYENPAALPRAWLVSKAVSAAGPDEAAAILKSPDFDPRTAVVLETSELPTTGEARGGSVSWTSRAPDRFELEVETKADAILVVSDTDYPGWEAELDDAKVPILRADLAFRALAVPAGRHRVTMRFRPFSARAGLPLSALSIVMILAFCFRRKTAASSEDHGIIPS